jgi:hypothetical protein
MLWVMISFTEKDNARIDEACNIVGVICTGTDDVLNRRLVARVITLFDKSGHHRGWKIIALKLWIGS